MLMPGWWYVISAESFLDRMTEMPDILELAPRVRCPVLYLRGDQESAETYPAEAFQARAGGPCEVQIIPDCDHFYNGREQRGDRARHRLAGEDVRPRRLRRSALAGPRTAPAPARTPVNAAETTISGARSAGEHVLIQHRADRIGQRRREVDHRHQRGEREPLGARRTDRGGEAQCRDIRHHRRHAAEEINHHRADRIRPARDTPAC